MTSAREFEKQRFAGDVGSGALQGSMKHDASCGVFASHRRVEKARHRHRRRGIERLGGMPPADIATILPAQHAIDHDVVETAAEERDLLQKILYQVCKETRQIVTLAPNRSGASAIERCLRRYCC